MPVFWLVGVEVLLGVDIELEVEVGSEEVVVVINPVGLMVGMGSVSVSVSS
jgi:hypothetical protein